MKAIEASPINMRGNSDSSFEEEKDLIITIDESSVLSKSEKPKRGRENRSSPKRDAVSEQIRKAKRLEKKLRKEQVRKEKEILKQQQFEDVVKSSAPFWLIKFYTKSYLKILSVIVILYLWIIFIIYSNNMAEINEIE